MKSPENGIAGVLAGRLSWRLLAGAIQTLGVNLELIPFLGVKAAVLSSQWASGEWYSLG